MLLERDHVLNELSGLTSAVREGRGKVALVAGEAGIGKTSVLRAFAAGIPESIRQLWTGFEDSSAPEALTILHEIREIGIEVPKDASVGGSRIALFRDALHKLGERPTILLVEDLHWADDSSADFLRYACRRLENVPLLIVVTSRDEELQARSRLARTIGDLPPAARVRFDLERLSSVAVGRLAAAMGQIGASIHHATNGNAARY